jgi:predicted phage terminase large subunit-like protein
VAEIRPQRGPQELFLSSPADVVIYGGAAGGGKTFGLLLEPLRHIHNPRFGAVIFRRTSVQVRNQGGLWDESMELYPLLGAEPRESTLEWMFPSGAGVKFAHLEHDKSRLDWQGSQIPLLCFDELPHFTRTQVFYMFSRNRSTCGVRPYIRATCNPVPADDETGGWIHEFVGWYIDAETGYVIPERSGVVRWFIVVDDALVWADTADELRERYPGAMPKSFAFIASSVYDNAILLQRNPEYLANLMALHMVDRERLLRGNWLIRESAGRVFNRAWFRVVDAAPAGGRTVRAWDMAATLKEIGKNDPDFTASVLMRRFGDMYYILDATSVQASPASVDAMLYNTATQDGKAVAVRFEEEGGASGKRDARTIVSLLAGWDVRGVRPTGDKMVRAKPLAAQAEAGNVVLVRGEWNEMFLRALHGFPQLAHDDLVDAASGAFDDLLLTFVSKPQQNRLAF